MADFTGQNIQDTYQRVVQVDGNQLQDGTGSNLPISFDGDDVIIPGTLRANSYIVSQSTTIATSGSTIFGNSFDDTHVFSGSVNIGDRVDTDYNDITPALFVRQDAVDRSQIANGFGGSIDFHIQRGSNASGARTGRIVSRLTAGAQTINDYYAIDFNLRSNDTQIDLMTLHTSNTNTSGRVGILDTTPSYTLDVNGDFRATGDINAGGNIVGDSVTSISGINTITAGSTISSSGNIIGSRLNTDDFIVGNTSLDTGILVDGYVETSGVNGRIIASSTISASGDVIGPTFGDIEGNLISKNDISASGNIYGTNFYGVSSFRLHDAGGTSRHAITNGSDDLTIAIGNSNFSNGVLITDAHLTASGNISASGTITGSNLSGTNTGDQDLSTYIQNSQTSSFITATQTSSFVTNSQTASFAVTESDVVFGNISASATIIANEANIIGHITASGNISASGNLDAVNIRGRSSLQVNSKRITYNATDLEVVDTGLSVLGGNITASGHISASGNIYGDVYYSENVAVIGYDGNINVGQLTSPLNLHGHITASSDISASGTISGSKGHFGSITLGTRLNANQIGSNGNVGNTEYGHLNGVTGAIQTQFDDIANKTGSYAVTGSDVTFNNVTASGDISASGTITANKFVGMPIHIIAHSWYFNNPDGTLDNFQAGSTTYGWSDRAWNQELTKASVDSGTWNSNGDSNLGVAITQDIKNIKLIGTLKTTDATNQGTLSYYVYKMLAIQTAGSNTTNPVFICSGSSPTVGNQFQTIYITGSAAGGHGGVNPDVGAVAGDRIIVFSSVSNTFGTNKNIKGTYTVTAEIA